MLVGLSFAYGTTSNNDAVIDAMGNGGTGYTGMVTSSISASLEKIQILMSSQEPMILQMQVLKGLKVLALYGVNKQHDIQTKNTPSSQHNQ